VVKCVETAEAWLHRPTAVRFFAFIVQVVDAKSSESSFGVYFQRIHKIQTVGAKPNVSFLDFYFT
jgi:hypothetical protein